MTRWPLCSGLATLVLSVSVLAQYRARIDGVRIDVLVTERGEAVTGLGSADFEVHDNGVVQHVERSEQVVAVSMVLLIDESFSVVGAGRLSELGAVAGMFVDGMSGQDSAAVISFSDRLRVRISVTRDREAVRRAITSALNEATRRQNDRTALWDAIFGAASLVVGEEARPVIVAFTDAADNASVTADLIAENAPSLDDQRRRSIDVLRASGVVIDTVLVPRFFSWLGDDFHGPLNQDEVTRSVGGRVFRPGEKNLRERIQARLRELRSSYVLSYTPSGPVKDGWHTIDVRLKGKKGRVEARPGYFSVPKK